MHVTPLFISLHWLPIAAHIKFKALMFAYRTTSRSAPFYLNSLLQTYVPSRSLRSASERCITVPSQRDTKSLSQTFSLTVPIWWNDLPNSIRAAESLAIFKNWLKTHSTRHLCDTSRRQHRKTSMLKKNSRHTQVPSHMANGETGQRSTEAPLNKL